MTEPTDETLHRGALAFAEFQEVANRLIAEGFDWQDILASIAALANEMIASRTDQSAATAWFYAMAINASRGLR